MGVRVKRKLHFVDVVDALTGLLILLRPTGTCTMLQWRLAPSFCLDTPYLCFRAFGMVFKPE